MTETLRLAQALIARASITPQDAGCIGLIADRLAPLGFVCEVIDSGPPDARVRNLWARRVSTINPRAGTLIFAGHVDVVPPGPLERWTSDPFTPTVRDGKLYGRGASDMKTSVAAFTVAVEQFLAARPGAPLTIALLLTSDEEGPAVDGTTVVVERLRARGERPDWCIVGEPTAQRRTGDMVKNGRRGSLSGRLVVRGAQGHIAYPHLARNPIHALLPALAELAALEWDRGNDYFPPTSWQISNFHAGTGATNVIPGEAVVDFNFRFGTASTPASLRERLETVLRQHALDYTLQWTLNGSPFLTEPGTLVDAVQAAIRAETGQAAQLSTTGGTSDGRFIATLCPQVIELGPPSASIHRIDEHVALADIEPLTAIYRRVLDNLADAPPTGMTQDAAQIKPAEPGCLSLADLVAQVEHQLRAAGVAFGHGTLDAHDEAAWLVLYALGLPLDTSISPYSGVIPIAPALQEPVAALLHTRIASRKPLAYLTHEAWLQGVPFYADERAIVPRSLIAELIGGDGLDPWLSSHTRRVLDLCTGSGSLACLAALTWPNVRVTGTDISVDALEVARINVARHALQRRVRLICGDGLSVSSGPWDLILCNPPYVNAASMAALPPEYRAEPALALAGGADGMDFIRALLRDLRHPPARPHLSPHGVLVLEIGHERAHFDAAFPDLPVNPLPTSAGEDHVLLITAKALELWAG